MTPLPDPTSAAPPASGPMPASAAAPPRDSATVVPMRDGAAGLEVLLLRRDDRGDPTGGAWVFPGGLVDARDALSHGRCVGIDDAAASARLGLPAGGLGFLVAAIRECFEECGLLFAIDARDRPVAPALVADLQDWRTPSNDGSRTLDALCERHALRLAADRLAYVGHWLTPAGQRRRFDTRFFIAEAPSAQEASPDGAEVVEHRWMRPADALAPAAALKLMNPTRKTLEALAAHAGVKQALDWARTLTDISRVEPHMGLAADGLRAVNPDESAWAEIRHLDPLGIAPPRCEIEPGVAVRLSRRVIRVTAPNAGMMTGPGTNTYLVGSNQDDDAASHWAVIDPGPDDPAHVAAILAAAPGPIRWILVTHTHLDHSPAANALRNATGACVFGRRPDHYPGQDETFAPDLELAGGQRIELGAGTTLRVVHTPGHASNHLCYLLEEERTLFTGDHVMQGSTVVIAPPDGDMAHYLRSLSALLRDEAPTLAWLAPGHGFLIARPARAMQALVAHRLRREARVVAALRAQGAAGLDALLEEVYADVPAHLHAPARRSLLAHLLKLESDGVATEEDGAWALAETLAVR